MFGGENIRKIAIAVMLLVAIGLVAGGYALISHDNPQVIDTPISDEASDNENLSVGKMAEVNGGVKDIHLSNANEVVKDIIYSNIFNVPKEISDNYGVDMPSFTGVVSYNNLDDGFIHFGDNSSTFFNNINKSEYVLSPYYNSSIFVKIGQDFTDKYGLCVEGGFIPLGNITKPIENIKLCDLSCGITDAYMDLDNPYVYDSDDVSYYMVYGEFPTDIQLKQFEYEQDRIKSFKMNYTQVDGQKEVFVNIHQDFTDKYMVCMDCGRFFALGNVTTPLDGIMICDYPTHFGSDVYINVDNPSVISREKAYDSWDPYLEDLYSNPDYRPIHFDEIGYNEDISQIPANDPLVDDTAQSHDYQIVVNQ